MQERSFRAMNTDVRVALNDAGSATGLLLQQAADEFGAYERSLSRFDPTSELTALNQAGPRWVFVSPILFVALKAARVAWAETNGLYNPAILPALLAAGYDRSFDLLTDRVACDVIGLNDEPIEALPLGAPAGSDAAPPYELATQAQAVCLSPGVQLDLGGIGKGLAVDAAAARLAGPHGFLIDAGGDVRVGGLSPDGGPWGVGVQDPARPGADLAVLAVTSGAIATSSIGRRRWLQAGAVRHHIIDPRTGGSAVSDVVAATVIAPECATAEVWAKTVVIAGTSTGFALLSRQQLPGLAVCTDGRLLVNEAMRSFLVEGDAATVPAG